MEQPVRYYGITDVGRKRDHNEDAFYISAVGNFGILADGMGGRHFGEVAAKMTVDIIRQKFETFFPPSYAKLRITDQTHCGDMVINLLDEWVRDANFQVWKKGQEDEKYREMGTTVVAAYTMPSYVVLAHVGDSRAYHIQGDEMTQVTVDHSLVNSQVESGMLTEEEAALSNQRNIITRAVGTSKIVKPEINTCHTKRGDRIVICSDGLSDMVADEVILELGRSADPQDAIQSLVNEANANGGKDNITIVLIDFSG
ncbi:MAG: Stp1/IreP family PP2C-type Ser/Thr phosphatase [Planctomycetota bacterium]